jgi:hypothetical protein
MSPMRRTDELDELLGAFALDAVDDEERRDVERYLATNARARAEVQDHREVATLLAFSGGAAPDGLWDRIVGSLDAIAPAPGPELAKVLPMAPARRRRGRVAAYAGGAVAAAAVVVLGVVAVQRGNELDDLRGEIASTTVQEGFGQAMADPASAKFVLQSPDGSVSAQAAVEPNGIGFLAAGDLAALPDDRTYQLWGISGDTVISLGVLGSRPEVLTFTVAGPLDALAITEEVAGGVPVSEQSPALVGQLT